MVQEQAATATGSKSFSDFMTAAKGLRPLIEEHADEAEKLRHQADPVVAALRESGIYTVLLPRDRGGAELSFVDAL